MHFIGGPVLCSMLFATAMALTACNANSCLQAVGETARCRPGTITCNGGPCQDALSDPKNCGKCGNVCASGICQNGACSNPVYNGAFCKPSGQGCTSNPNYFCFEGANSTFFCGENVACAQSPPCSSNTDCAPGSLCVATTCCESSICVAVCRSQSGKRGMAFVERKLGGTNATYAAGVPPTPGF